MYSLTLPFSSLPHNPLSQPPSISYTPFTIPLSQPPFRPDVLLPLHEWVNAAALNVETVVMVHHNPYHHPDSLSKHKLLTQQQSNLTSIVNHDNHNNDNHNHKSPSPPHPSPIPFCSLPHHSSTSLFFCLLLTSTVLFSLLLSYSLSFCLTSRR